jgi:DNA polymerase/3'-5' exonuclease PolX
MSNSKIIKEFEKLVSYVKLQDKNQPTNIFRLKNIKLALSIITKYPNKITLNNLNDFSQLNGIGKGTIERIKEILSNGHLSELESLHDETKESNISDKLEDVIGIGKSTAAKLIKLGIKSVKDLKANIKNNEIKISNTIKTGLKYYGVYRENIPRSEIDQINKLIAKTIDKKYIHEICGSYRRGKDMSNDIDVLFTMKEYKGTDNLKTIIDELTQIGFLVDSLTKNNKTKYMGFCKYNDNPVRRIDIRFVKYESFYSALLYFTGPGDFNRNMRSIAKKQGYKLSEYGLMKDNKNEKISSEKDIFDLLGIKYILPNER